MFNQEIHEHDNPVEPSDTSLLDDTSFVEKTESQHLETPFNELESSSIVFDDNTSVGTAVNGQPIEESNRYDDGRHYSFSGPANNKAKDIVNAKIIEVSNYASDDYRFLKE